MYWRYRGDISMWAWFFHRLTGIGIFVFLLVHIVDTALIGWGRDVYDAVVQLYHHPVFRVGEILLIGVVLFHALNGVRVVILDFAPQTTVYQRQMLAVVVVAFFVLFIPSAFVMFAQTVLVSKPCELSWDWGGWCDLWAWLSALVSAFAIAFVAIPSGTVSRPAPLVPRPIGGLEFYGWLFMRVSGLLLIFLVLGHLFIMHFPDGGVYRINFDFVVQRFATPFWRTYDFVMLTLAMLHGTWGMRTVLLDYVHRPNRRLLALTVLYFVSGVILALGALVLFAFYPK